MLYSLAADILLVVHFLFIGFVVLGGLLVFKWRWLVFLHLPAAVWGDTDRVPRLALPAHTLGTTASPGRWRGRLRHGFYRTLPDAPDLPGQSPL